MTLARQSSDAFLYTAKTETVLAAQSTSLEAAVCAGCSRCSQTGAENLKDPWRVTYWKAEKLDSSTSKGWPQQQSA